MNQKALCIVSRYPKKEWINFLSKFQNYDIYIVADDNSVDFPDFSKDFANITIIQFSDEECEKSGFVGTLNGIGKQFIVSERSIFGWDKAFYYFAKINTHYEYVWFLEEDVFIYDEMSILKLDDKYRNVDLLSPEIKQDFIDNNSNLPYPSSWWWRKMYNIGNFKPETTFYRGFAFHIRLSKEFIKKIEDYADQNKTLYYHEAFIPMICMKNNLVRAEPQEMLLSRACIELNIGVKNKILGAEKDYLFHPIKDLSEHEKYRSK